MRGSARWRWELRRSEPVRRRVRREDVVEIRGGGGWRAAPGHVCVVAAAVALSDLGCGSALGEEAGVAAVHREGQDGPGRTGVVKVMMRSS